MFVCPGISKLWTTKSVALPVMSGLLSLNTLSNGSYSTLKMIPALTQIPTGHQDVNANRFHSVLGWGSME